jgi:hypothetical protein
MYRAHKKKENQTTIFERNSLMKRFFYIFLAVFILAISTGVIYSQDIGGVDYDPSDQNPNRPTGLTVNTDEVQEGYILIPALQNSNSLLLSNDGRIVKVWEGEYHPANMIYLKDNGNLVRSNHLLELPFSGRPYSSGRFEEIAWDGELVWSIELSDERTVPHHDFHILPNGNLVILAYDRYYGDEILAAGLDPELLPSNEEIWSEKLIEINPMTNEIVWEWSVWDHLIQDFDPNLPNYGVVVDNPGRININYIDRNKNADWLHQNTVNYNEELDHIFLSNKATSEIWIVDHGISTEEARGEAGNLLYRWGNPEAHDAGTDEDQQLYEQHDPHWIPAGYPGAGNVLVFDNGNNRERPYSRVIEIELPVDENGNYIMNPGEPTGPSEPVWEYVSDPVENFYSRIISGSQRQLNGNTLIASGHPGRIFEVNPEGEIVWEYYLPSGGRLFRAERYDLAVFEDLDQGQDFSEELRFYEPEWSAKCVDEDGVEWLRPHLTEDGKVIDLFVATYGEDAEQIWGEEFCADKGGVDTE